MAYIYKYTTKANKDFYGVQVFAGRDETTGKKKIINKRGFDTKKQASLYASRLEIQIEKGDLFKPKEYLFKDVFNQWYQNYVNTVRESTWNSTIGIFKKHILPEFAEYKINKITPHQCQVAINKWFTEAPHNYKRWFNYTSSIFEYAILNQYIKDNPTKRVTVPKREDQWGDKPVNFWNKEQLHYFFELIDKDRYLERYTLFRVLAFTGLRRGECLALTWDDINFTDNTLKVNKTLTQGERGKQIIQAPKTKKARRTIFVDDETMNILKDWKQLQTRLLFSTGYNTLYKDDQLVFASNRNTFKSLNTPAKWLKLIIAGHEDKLPKITIHGFRHSHASAMFSAGATIKEVQDRLGHEDAQTTLNIYTHVSDNQNKQAVKRLVNYLDF